MVGSPPSLGLEHSNFMSQELNPMQLRDDGPWAQMRPALHREQRPLQSAAPQVGNTTGQAVDMYRVPIQIKGSQRGDGRTGSCLSRATGDAASGAAASWSDARPRGRDWISEKSTKKRFFPRLRLEPIEV